MCGGKEGGEKGGRRRYQLVHVTSLQLHLLDLEVHV